ncbi:MAG TPA: zinc ribbon domain-containing protein [Gemmatimonadales bacterium]|nr:zinc ribbon domain-containing protein [Gemmatimonadales bacterium]
MPTYEYQCPDGHVFEKLQKMSEKPRAKCPVCGKAAVRKISGGAGLVFKGTGFYITDYGKDGKGPRKEGVEKPEKAEKTEKTERTGKTEATQTSGEAKKKLDSAPPKSPPSHGKGKASSE